MPRRHWYGLMFADARLLGLRSSFPNRSFKISQLVRRNGIVPISARRIVRPRVIAGLVAALILIPQFRSAAHDIPNDVTVQAFLKPEGQTLHMIVRVPLRACRDVDFPMRGPGYLDLARADASLRDAATLWISDNVELYEGDTR